MSNKIGGFSKEVALRGSIASATFRKNRANEKYDSVPRYCIFCSKLLKRVENKKTCVSAKQTYCSQICSAKERWRLFYEATGKKPRSKFSPIKTTVLFKTKSTATRQQIARHANNVYFAKFPKTLCQHCGIINISVDVAHVQAVSDFSKTATLHQINLQNNLIGLCPNCHRQFDSGVILLEVIKEKVASRSPQP